MTKKQANPVVKFLQQNLVLIGIVILIIVTAIVNPKFLGAANLTNVMRQLGALPFVALGMTFVITGGGAEYVDKLVRHPHTYDPDMMLKGLAYLYTLNK